MIDVALDFLQKQLNVYLRLKLDPASNSDFIKLQNISQLQEAGGGDDDLRSAYISLVNIEEDRISKSPENFVRRDNGVVYKNPKIFLNLYVLFSANLSLYTESLKRISLIIQFFQYRNVFDVNNSPTLDTRIEKLIADMNTIGFEQLNNLWSVLGGKYMPSVLYKIRLVTIEEETIDASGTFIKTIAINENNS